MSYEIKAVIASRELLEVATMSLPAACVVDLRDGLALVPMTDALFNVLSDSARATFADFWGLPAGFDRVLVEWSRDGVVAYVEAEYFGGVGAENVAVWREGRLGLTLRLAEGEPVPTEGTPIRRALRELGVRASEEDEFTVVGLGAHRDTTGWLSRQ